MKFCPVDHRPSEGTYLVSIERDEYFDEQTTDPQKSLGGANKRAVVIEVSERQNHRCAHCGTELTFWWEYEDIIEPWKLMVEDQTRFALFDRKVGRIRNLAIMHKNDGQRFVVCQECDWHKCSSIYTLTHEAFFTLRQDDNRWSYLVKNNAKETELYISRKRRKHRLRVMRQGEMQNHRCCYCGKRMFYSWEKSKKYQKEHLNDLATVEHIIPKSRGGTLKQSNTAIACSGCNVARGNMPLKKWLKKLENKKKPTPTPPPRPPKPPKRIELHIAFAKKLAVLLQLMEQPNTNLTLLSCFLLEENG